MGKRESDIDPIYALAAEAHGGCFAARESGLYRSDDGVETWQNAYAALKPTSPLSTTALGISPTFMQDRTLFAGIPGAILRSTDAARTWHEFPLPDPPTLISALAVSPAYDNDGFLLATTFRRGVFYSVDRGETWLTGNFSLLDFRVLTLAFSPAFADNRTILIGTETGVFNSANSGRSWQAVDLPYVAVPSIAFASQNIVYAGTDGDGLYISADKGLTWSRSSLDTTLSISLVLTPSERDLFVFADATLYRSHDAGETWTIHELNAPATAAAPLNEAQLLVGYANGTISRIGLQP